MKKYLTPTKLLLLFAAIMFIIIFGKFFSIIVFPDSNTVLIKGELFQMKPATSLTQTFVANQDNLMKIELLMRTPGPQAGDVVKMEIADETCANVIRQGELQKSFLGSDNLYDFQFSKIPDSNGKTYCLKTTLQKNSSSKFIRFFMMENQNPQFTLTDMSNTNITASQSLSMRLAYRNDTLSQDMNEISQRISQYKPWFLKNFYLDAIAILFIILSITLVVILISF